MPQGERSRVRGLLASVIIMGVLIVVGVATLAITIVRRLSAPPLAESDLVLNEPPGTRMQSIAAAGDRLAILLTGGGADRIVLFDPRTGQVRGHIDLPH